MKIANKYFEMLKANNGHKNAYKGDKYVCKNHFQYFAVCATGYYCEGTKSNYVTGTTQKEFMANLRTVREFPRWGYKVALMPSQSQMAGKPTSSITRRESFTMKTRRNWMARTQAIRGTFSDIKNSLRKGTHTGILPIIIHKVGPLEKVGTRRSINMKELFIIGSGLLAYVVVSVLPVALLILLVYYLLFM